MKSNKKRIIVVLAILTMALVLSCALVACDNKVEPDKEPSEGLEYSLNSDGKGYTVMEIGTCTDKELIIPSEYKAKPVTSIGKDAFSGCYRLTSITIPDSVRSIGDGAFFGCDLTSVTIGNGVTSIGSSAFYGCTGLTSVTIGNGVTSIGRDAFYNTAWYNNQPNGLVYAGKVAYKYKGTMPSNTSIVLREGTLGIGYSAFDGCTGLTSVTIGKGVTSIGESAFYNCTGLRSITIPDSVTSLGWGAFAGCTGLRSITISDSVTSIGNWAFEGCTGLTSVTIPDSVTSIGYSAFAGCTGLTSVTIPDSVTIIVLYAFDGCTGLTRITFSGTIKQWNAISKGYYWKDGVPATQVICKDGTVSI